MVNDGDEDVPLGPTDSDEMCIFYIMYYVDEEEFGEDEKKWRVRLHMKSDKNSSNGGRDMTGAANSWVNGDMHHCYSSKNHR